MEDHTAQVSTSDNQLHLVNVVAPLFPPLPPLSILVEFTNFTLVDKDPDGDIQIQLDSLFPTICLIHRHTGDITWILTAKQVNREGEP